MKKIFVVAAVAALALLLVAGTALAATGKVTNVSGEKVTIAAKGTGFKTGEQIMVKSGDDYVTATVNSASGDSLVVTLKRKASFVQEGKSVTLEKRGSAAMQGC